MPNKQPRAAGGRRGADVRERSTDGRSTRWDAHRAERREQLVEAAMEVLAESGPEFGLDQVAERAGVTKPVIYRHFTDRAALVDALGQHATVILIEQRVMPALHADQPVLARIRGCIDAFLGFLDDHPNIYWIFTRHASESAGGGDVAHTDKELITVAVSAVLAEFLRHGDVDPGVAEVWARGLVGFVQNTAEWWLEQRVLTREQLADHLANLVWAQIDGLARQHGRTIDPQTPLHPEDLGFGPPA